MTPALAFHADAYRPGTRHRSHGHAALHLSMVLRGHVAETVGAVTEHAGPLSVVAKDSGVVHANDFGAAGAKLARLTLPAGTIGALLDDPTRTTGWRWTHSAAVANPFLRLVARARGGATSFQGTDPDVLDLLAAFTARQATPARGRPPAWLQETVQEMRQSWHPGLTVGDVARRAGVHPVYLARVVRRWYGTSVGDELRRLRIRWAARMVGEQGGTLSSVAHACGFADEPHLCRDFRNALGMTPGGYRTLIGELAYQTRGRA